MTRALAAGLMILGAVSVVVMGLVVGVPAAPAAGRFLGSQLCGQSPHKPAVIRAAVVLPALSAPAAPRVPAVRAAMVSPVESLRAEYRSKR